MSKALRAAIDLTSEDSSVRERGLAELRSAIEAGEDLDERDDHSLRAIDLIARGIDSAEASEAIELMADSFAEEMMTPPAASDMPPMMRACYRGNPGMVEKFLELGMPGDVIASAPAAGLLKGTPFHAVVLGYVQVQQDAFARCMSLLLAYCPHGIDIPDRLNQRPVDLATKKAAATGDRTLADAMIAYGASLTNGSKLDAASFLRNISKDNDELRAMLAHNAGSGVLRKLERLKNARP